ncbi:MAG TPA: squalene/phytoene synthase family protein [Ktedonobacterales bacterium]|nr:squalene/phytoene synthase family protein [Ktedonobacterales bacterium]
MIAGGDCSWLDDDSYVTAYTTAREPLPAQVTTPVVSVVATAQVTANERRESLWTKRGYAQAPTLPVAAVSPEQAYEYCRDVARVIARTFYYGSLFLPRSKRRATWALYAFCRTADDIADEPALFPQPLAELEGWRQGLLETYAGRPRGPVMTAWADMLRTYPVPIEPALDLLSGVEMDIAGARYDTFDELRLYCYRVAGTVGLLMAPILGIEDASATGSAVDLGIAMQLTNILRDIGEDARNGRMYLPREDLARFGVTEGDIQRGAVTPAFRALMRFEIARTREYFARGLRGVALLSPDARLAIQLSGELYRAILDRIVRNEYDVFTCRAHVSLPAKLAALPGAWAHSRRG